MASRRKKILLTLGAIVLLVASVLGYWAWITFHVDDIPDELPAMERSPSELVVSSLGHGDDLAFSTLRDQTSVIVFEGIQSMRSEQGKQVNRALNRWTLPETTKGYIVWDGEGMRLFEEKASKFLGFFAEELRFPIFVDFDGELVDIFKLVKGHHGLIVLDPQGQVLMRHSGGLDDDHLEELRTLLGAAEPPEPEPAPPFTLAGLDNASCNGKACLFIFVGKKVVRGDIPWIENGFEGTRTECFERMHRPEIRLAASAMRVPIKQSHGVVVGDVEGLELEGWKVAPDDLAARQAFGFEPEDSGLVVIDDKGRMVFRETGFIPMYRWTLAVDPTGEKILREGGK
ncbi:MAG: hypothetical protein K0V04_01340 [Deltaproteobacteria bacterium]|nr:hypothetical protein [Deltaproteobacteria bacterium]